MCSCSGTLSTGGHVLCSSKGSRERIGRMMEMHSNDRQVRMSLDLFCAVLLCQQGTKERIGRMMHFQRSAGKHAAMGAAQLAVPNRHCRCCS